MGNHLKLKLGLVPRLLDIETNKSLKETSDFQVTISRIKK
jgi:hypothetical protein